MKCSNYLWMYKKTYANASANGEDWSPERAQGETRLILGDENITNDINGKEMTEREAMSIYGRNSDVLNSAFENGDRSTFDGVVTEALKNDIGNDNEEEV